MEARPTDAWHAWHREEGWHDQSTGWQGGAPGAQGAPGTQKGYMAVAVAEGKCVWLHVGGGLFASTSI